MSTIPEKPSLDGIEARWMQQWEADGTFVLTLRDGRVYRVAAI